MTNPPSGRHPISSTEATPPTKRTIVASPIVKVTLPEPGTDDAAFIASRDGKYTMTVPRSAVSKRFNRGERVLYFKSELDGEGILELGDRLPDEDW